MPLKTPDQSRLHRPSEAESTIQKFYRKYIRQYLPSKVATLNGVPVYGPVKIGEKKTKYPNYEEKLCKLIRKYVSDGDEVVLIGGGTGVSSVLSAEAGAENVHTYEATKSGFEQISDTIERCDFEDIIHVNHAVVGEYNEHSRKNYGPSGGARQIEPNSLPASDILITDCEGTEIEILSEIETLPDKLIIEYHGFLGCSDDDVIKILEERNYSIVENLPHHNYDSKGVGVLFARRS